MARLDIDAEQSFAFLKRVHDDEPQAGQHRSGDHETHVPPKLD
jgi:hypothetical protein